MSLNTFEPESPHWAPETDKDYVCWALALGHTLWEGLYAQYLI